MQRQQRGQSQKFAYLMRKNINLCLALESAPVSFFILTFVGARR